MKIALFGASGATGMLLTARCLGSCGLAPAVVYDQEVAGKVATPAIREHLKKWTHA